MCICIKHYYVENVQGKTKTSDFIYRLRKEIFTTCNDKLLFSIETLFYDLPLQLQDR